MEEKVLWTDSIFINTTDSSMVLEVIQQGVNGEKSVVKRIGFSNEFAKRLVEEMRKVIK